MQKQNKTKQTVKQPEPNMLLFFKKNVSKREFSPSYLSFVSASFLFSTSGPHGPEGGLLREARIVPRVVRVCSHHGLLQGTAQPLHVYQLLFSTLYAEWKRKLINRDKKLYLGTVYYGCYFLEVFGTVFYFLQVQLSSFVNTEKTAERPHGASPRETTFQGQNS